MRYFNDFEIEWPVEHDPHFCDVPVKRVGTVSSEATNKAEAEPMANGSKARPPPRTILKPKPLLGSTGTAPPVLMMAGQKIKGGNQMKKTDTVTAGNITMTVGEVLKVNERCASNKLGQCYRCPLYGAECICKLIALSYEALKLALAEEETNA